MTKGRIVFRNAAGEIVLIVYVNHDGYPEGLGVELADLLLNLQPLRLDFGCLAVQAAGLLMLEELEESEEGGGEDERETWFIAKHLLPLVVAHSSPYLDADCEYSVRGTADGVTISVAEWDEAGDFLAGEALSPSAFRALYGAERSPFVALSQEDLWYPWHAFLEAAIAGRSLDLDLEAGSQEAGEGERVAIRFEYGPGEFGPEDGAGVDDEAVVAYCLIVEGAGQIDHLAEVLPDVLCNGCGMAEALLLILARPGTRVRATSAEAWPRSCYSRVRIFSDPDEPDEPRLLKVEAVWGDAPPFATSMATYVEGHEDDSEAAQSDEVEEVRASVSPALEALADYMRVPRWSPATHHLFPLATREHVRLLLLIETALRDGRGLGFRDAWLDVMMPHAVHHHYDAGPPAGLLVPPVYIDLT